jgi:hypothetical protein
MVLGIKRGGVTKAGEAEADRVSDTSFTFLWIRELR